MPAGLGVALLMPAVFGFGPSRRGATRAAGRGVPCGAAPGPAAGDCAAGKLAGGRGFRSCAVGVQLHAGTAARCKHGADLGKPGPVCRLGVEPERCH